MRSTATIGLMVTVVAAAILAARPRHVVGVVLAALGLVWNLNGLAESWAARSLAHNLPGTDAAYWFVARFGAFLLTGLVVLLLVYPSGRLIAGRLRPAAVGVLALASLLPLGLLLAPDAVVFQEGRPAGVRTDFLGACRCRTRLRRPRSGWPAWAPCSAVLGALVLLVLRHRGAAEEERTHGGWLLWAEILCLLAALVILLVGPGTVSTAILAVAVLTVSASVAVGVVKLDLADVDTLVAGTLTYAGVAAIVVGVDLAVLAIANELLGSRLDERDVTLLVLVLAVAVYGPLRTWLGGRVRRLMFGRRGDRYGVVSTFAARLEDTDSVQEQLPTLVSAVASTFKVPFVRVEVIVSGGRVLSVRTTGSPPPRSRSSRSPTAASRSVASCSPVVACARCCRGATRTCWSTWCDRRPSPCAAACWPRRCRTVASGSSSRARTTGAGSGATCTTAWARCWVAWQ